MKSKSLRTVYTASADGHRLSYQITISTLLGMESLVTPMSFTVATKLIYENYVIFSTADDHLFSFTIISWIRRFLGKTTKGILLNPRQCFNLKRPFISLIKYIALRSLKFNPRCSLFSIVPYQLYPRASRITKDYIYDPQLWDSHATLPLNSHSTNSPNSTIGAKISGARDNRVVLAYIGSIKKQKGISELISAISKDSDLSSKILIVIAGKPTESIKSLISSVDRPNLIVEQRYITDHEIIDIYNSSDLIWCSYENSYDQFSGIFGRSVQYKKIPILRKESMIQLWSESEGIPHITWKGSLQIALKDFTELVISNENGNKTYNYYVKSLEKFLEVH